MRQRKQTCLGAFIGPWMDHSHCFKCLMTFNDHNNPWSWVKNQYSVVSMEMNENVEKINRYRQRWNLPQKANKRLGRSNERCETQESQESLKKRKNDDDKERERRWERPPRLQGKRKGVGLPGCGRVKMTVCNKYFNFCLPHAQEAERTKYGHCM